MKLSRLSALVYSILFLGSFLIGSLGVAPILEVDSQMARVLYIFFIIIGYTFLAVLFVLWYRGDLERFIHQYFRKEQENIMGEDLDETSLETQEEINSNEINGAMEETTENIDEEEERGRSTMV